MAASKRLQKVRIVYYNDSKCINLMCNNLFYELLIYENAISLSLSFSLPPRDDLTKFETRNFCSY